MARALINVPPKAKRGDIIEIKTLISHVMEPGYRPDSTGNVLPRDIINLFVCTYNGQEIFRAELFAAVAGRGSRRRPRQSPPRAASLSSNGAGTTGFRRRRPRPSPSNEHLASGLVAT